MYCISNLNFFLRSIFLSSVVEPLVSSLEQLASGLNKFRLVDLIKQSPNPDDFKPLFCHSEIWDWTYDVVVELLSPEWSEDGSNKKKAELSIYKILLELLEYTSYDGRLTQIS